MTDGPQDGEGNSTWDRLRRRKVVQWGLAYATGAWGLLQGLSYAIETFQWPSTLQPLATLTLLTGLPIALVLAWYHGDKGQQRVTAAELAIITLLFVLGGAMFWRYERGSTDRASSSASAPGDAMPTAVAPAAEASAPPNSIAVLPFVNMSGDKEQEYFSDGLTEELLHSLALINELQVAARTSAFSFKGTNTDIGTIARKLNVAAVLEGSVRRSGHTVRITAQLINAATGYHLWSETYDRDLGDVLKLQTEVATSVASALRVTLLGDVSAKIELGGTRNAAAFDAYLRGQKALSAIHDDRGFQTAINAYTEAIGLDANYALAYAQRSLALTNSGNNSSGSLVREIFEKAHSDALRAIELAPTLAEAHVALAFYFDSGPLEFARAKEEYERAQALAPGNAQVMRSYGLFATRIGRTEAGLAAARRAVALDPLNVSAHRDLAFALLSARRYVDAVQAFDDALALDPEDSKSYGFRGLAFLGRGEYDNARLSCEVKPAYWAAQWCLAVVYNKLDRHADAERTLANMEAAMGDNAAYQYATIHAQWGNTSTALAWLETALRVHDSGLLDVKTDFLMDPLRKEPRFQAVLRKLNFPD